MARQTELTCPSGLRVKLRSIKGKDLDGLRDKRRVATGEAISELLNNCTVEVIDRAIYTKLPSFDWADALIGDRMHALIGLRKATNGSEFEFNIRCQDRDCRQMIHWKVELDDLPMKALSEESKTVFLDGGNKFIVEVADKEVAFGLNTGRDQAKFARQLEKIRQAPKNGAQQKHEHVLFGIVSQIFSVDGLEPKDILPWLEDLDLVEIQALRKEMEAVDCGIETGIAIVCQSCDFQQEVDLPLDSTFFGGGM